MSDESLEKQAITWHERRQRVIGIWLARPQNGANVNYFEQFTDDELLSLERAYRATENQFRRKADQCSCVLESRREPMTDDQLYEERVGFRKKIRILKERISALEAQCDDLMRPIVEEGNQAMRLKDFEDAGRELIQVWNNPVRDWTLVQSAIAKLGALDKRRKFSKRAATAEAPGDRIPR